MHNIKDLRKNLDYFKKKLKDRNLEFDVDKFNKLDELNRKLINDKEKLEQEKKSLSKSKDKSNFDNSKKKSDVYINGGFFVISKTIIKLIKNTAIYIENEPFKKIIKNKRLIKKLLGKRILLIKFEDFVTNTNLEMKKISKFLNTSFTKSTKNYIREANCPRKIDNKISEKKFGIEIEILSKFVKSKNEIIETPISYSGRSYTEGKKITFKDGIGIFLKVIKYKIL